LGVLAAVLALTLAGARRLGEPARSRLSRGFALVLLAYLLGSFAYYARQGDPIATLLPLHLCDSLFVTAAWMLWTRSRLAFELTYFWTLGGTLQALATPDVAEGFPHWRFCLFFATHALPVLAALWGVFVFRLRPAPRSIWRAWLGLNVLAAIAALANWALGTNFLFLRAKPAGASLLDWLGPWPWYLVTVEALALVSFAFWYLPFARPRRLPLAPPRASDAGVGREGPVP
ncbi:MAG: TIGR02206 family membrane protein, partial [Thermoanaerobaculia bacterium]